MAEPASLPLDPAVLETEVFGTIVARLVAGFASLASSPTRTSVAWSQVRVSVNLTRRVPEGDSPPPVGRESYRVSVEATPGRGIAPGDTSVAAFISRLFVGGEHAVLLPEQVGDVYLATATRGENVVRTYEWRGRFGRAWHRMDVFDPRDSQAAATPQQRRAGPNQEPDDASRLMERARRETRPKSAAGLLPNHAFTTAAFTWTPSAGVVVLFADPNPARGALGSQAPAGSASLILSNTVDAVERQVECLPVECQVDVTVSDPTSARAIGRRITATRGPSPPSVHNEIREHKLTFRGVAQGPPGTGRGSTEGWTATVAVSLVTVDDADVANVVKSESPVPLRNYPIPDIHVTKYCRLSRVITHTRHRKTDPFLSHSRVTFFENGGPALANAALAAGALDWICMSPVSVWDTCNLPRVSRRAIRERVDNDGVVSLAFDAQVPHREPVVVPLQNENVPVDPTEIVNAGGAATAAAVATAAALGFKKHAYRVHEIVVHLTRDTAFIAPPTEETRSNQYQTQNQSPPGPGAAANAPGPGDFFFPDTLWQTEPAQSRPGEFSRARSKLVLRALEDALWQAKRFDKVSFASEKERTKAANALIVIDAQLHVLRRAALAGAVPQTLLDESLVDEYRKRMTATAFEDARYDAA